MFKLYYIKRVPWMKVCYSVLITREELEYLEVGFDWTDEWKGIYVRHHVLP